MAQYKSVNCLWNLNYIRGNNRICIGVPIWYSQLSLLIYQMDTQTWFALTIYKYGTATHCHKKFWRKKYSVNKPRIGYICMHLMNKNFEVPWGISFLVHAIIKNLNKSTHVIIQIIIWYVLFDLLIKIAFITSHVIIKICIPF